MSRLHRGENSRPRCRAPTAAELFWYPNLFWYTPTRNWLVEASIASILPLMWWGLLPALP